MAEAFWFSRNKSQFLIDSWLVLLNWKAIKKSSEKISKDDSVKILEDKKVEYVSRSAEKLEKFLEESPLDLSWKIALDVGASTWWFTQVLFSKWIWKVFAVDVWKDQLHEKIKSDSRVISFEECDIREFQYDEQFDLIVSDVSFISLKKIFDSITSLASENTKIILLFKPQFEVWKENIRKTWVPKSDKIIDFALNDFEFFIKERGFSLIKKAQSQLIWEAGNREWFFWVEKIV